MTDEVQAAEPGKYLSVAGLEEFRSRVRPAERRELSDAQKLWRDATQAAAELNGLGLQPTLDLISQKLRGRWARKTLIELLATEKWVTAMETRGIPWNAETDTLTPLQQSFLAFYYDTATTATHGQKLRQAKVSAEQFRGWMRQPVFAREMERLRQNVLKDGLHIATQRLVEKADAGDIQAIDRVMAFNGEDFRTLSGEDVAALLGLIFQVLDEEKVDPRVAMRIAAVTRGTTSGAQATMSPTTMMLPEAK